MYNTVSVFFMLGVLFQAFNFLKTLAGPGISQFGLTLPSWAIAASALPGLVASIVVLILFFQKNACAFWAYLVLVILHAGGAIQTVTTAWHLAGGAATLNAADAFQDVGVLILVTTLLVKIVLSWMMWKLIQRGELRYPAQGRVTIDPSVEPA